jgi:hypothetical protein
MTLITLLCNFHGHLVTIITHSQAHAYAFFHFFLPELLKIQHSAPHRRLRIVPIANCGLWIANWQNVDWQIEDWQIEDWQIEDWQIEDCRLQIGFADFASSA